MTRRVLIAGNWKMNGLAADLAEIDAMAAGAAGAPSSVDLLVCPPAVLIAAAASRAGGRIGGRIGIGGQDCHAAPKGAHTGDLSAEMLADAGASHVILGHSERRADHGESDAAVRAKVEAAWRAGLTAILCVGETEAERDAGAAVARVTGQLAASMPDGATAARLVVAYEPVWAIGTGRTAGPAEIGEMHGAIRAALAGALGAEADGVRILYGGSVKPANAAEILAVADVDGALVGGASLKAADLLAIAAAAPA